MYRFTICALVATCFCLLNMRHAMADETEDAKAVFDKAIDAFEDGRYVESAAMFREANQIKENYKLFYNIGQAEAAAGNNGKALEAFETYMSRGNDAIPSHRQEEVLEEINRLRSITGSVDIQAPDGCEVFLNDELRGITPLAGSILISAGITHQLTIVRLGETLFSRKIRVNGAQLKTISVLGDAGNSNTEEDGPDNTSDDVTDDSGDNQGDGPDGQSVDESKIKKIKILGWTLVATGAAALIGGGVTGGLAFKKRDDFYGRCGSDATAACDDDSQEMLDASRLAGTLSTALLISGGVLAGAGVAILIVGKKKENQQATLLRPIASPNFIGVHLSRRF